MASGDMIWRKKNAESALSPPRRCSSRSVCLEKREREGRKTWWFQRRRKTDGQGGFEEEEFRMNRK
jgi:hypothetical protein